MLRRSTLSAVVASVLPVIPALAEPASAGPTFRGMRRFRATVRFEGKNAPSGKLVGDIQVATPTELKDLVAHSYTASVSFTDAKKPEIHKATIQVGTRAFLTLTEGVNGSVQVSSIVQAVTLMGSGPNGFDVFDAGGVSIELLNVRTMAWGGNVSLVPGQEAKIPATAASYDAFLAITEVT